MLEAAQRDSELQARVVWNRRESLRLRADVARQRARVAADLLDSYQAQFAIGRRSLLDLLEAGAAAYNAQVDAESAQTGALTAEYALLAAANRLDEALGVQQPAPGAASYGPR